MLKNMNKQELKPILQEHKPRSQEHSIQRFSFPTFLISQIELNTQNFIPNISLKPVNQNPTKSIARHLNHPKSTTNNISLTRPTKPNLYASINSNQNHQTTNHRSSINPKGRSALETDKKNPKNLNVAHHFLRIKAQITQTITYQQLGSSLREEKSEGEVERGLEATA